MVPTVEAYRMAIRAMLGWIEKNMDLKKTRVFFSSMSPSHEKWVKQVNFFPVSSYSTGLKNVMGCRKPGTQLG